GTWNLSEEEWTINRIVLVLENDAMGWDIEDEDEDEWINVLNVASRHDPLDYVPVIVGEPEITAVVTIGQLFVIETEQVQDRRVQVVDVNLVIHRARAELVGCAVDRAALDAAPGEPEAERAVVMVAARIVVAVAIARDGPAEFAAPEHERALEQPALLQVGEQGRSRLVDLVGALFEALFN